MFKRVLIANRGEIAIRIARAASALGVESVGVYPAVDRLALHTQLTSSAREIASASADPVRAYLDIEAIIAAAKASDCDCVHPGYGFLSENANFAQRCAMEGLRFIGPSPASLALFGDKIEARAFAQSLQIPVLAGTPGPLASGDEARAMAQAVGYPVMLKAAAGGGGRGMRVVSKAEDMAEAFARCQGEAEAAFGNRAVFLEKLVPRPRHIEVQVLGDSQGQVVHLHERDCSVQLRNQKLIEIAPAPNLDGALRQRMLDDALKLARAARYENAGTVEFLVCGQDFYFLEVNPRLQVEHPVTELATGVDLVYEQLRVAMGEKLSVTQEDIVQRGHAIECRIYAEDPSRGFTPAPGPLLVYRPPMGPGLRIDDGFGEGDEIPRFYDSMIAKLSAWAPDRARCVGRMAAALERFEIAGFAHNIEHLQQVLASETFQVGPYDTGLVGTLPPLRTTPDDDDLASAFAAIWTHRQRQAQKPAATAENESLWQRTARTGGLRAR